jgi:hypothetical protein
MLSSLEHMIKMANDIANFCGPANPGDFEAGAHATAGHIKRFWIPSMRKEFSEQASDLANGLDDVARRAAYILWEEINE